MVTVRDMYNKSKTDDTKLLSEFDATFWNEYKTNYKQYDMLFNRYYFSFHFFMQECDESIDSVTDNFTAEVYNHLLVNKKKYEELYRINVIDDEKYSLYNNYDIVETMDRDVSFDKGSMSVNGTSKIAPYDSDEFHNDSSTATTESNRHDNGAEDYTMKRTGNIGIQSVSDLLEKHKKFWSKWDFYNYVFMEICRELLLV